jgi:DNA topoisomerase-2
MSSSTSPVNKNTKVSKTKSSTPAAAQGSGDLAKYQKMTDREHILNKPDTYIGSVETTETIDYVIEGNTLDTHKMVRKPFTYVPGLYKLFDEGLVNCRDHVIRQSLKSSETSFPVTNIEIEISKEDGTITLLNDGDGIDVAQHPEHKLWIPEMIFGHLRTSTNYDEDKKEKIVGGKNGFGFKLVLIWSVWGRIETVDHTRGLKYTQEFHDNLTRIDPPSITKSKVKPYTKVSFRPDYARFGCPGNNLTPDMLALFMKRVYDIAAVTDKTVKVKYNGEIVPVKHFQQYVDLYIGGKGEVKRIYESPNPRWEYVVCLTPTDEFCHVSFVNGIYTQRGGKHVEYIVNQIVRKLAALIKTKKKVDVKPNTIKEQLMLFLRCDIENPSFSSQTKDELGTAVSNFGSTCSVSDEFIEKLAKMGVMEAACALTEVKDTKAAKKTDGTKVKTVRGIPKLIDANYAGTDKSGDCTIIFCEGDSAKAGIVSGLTKEDRNYIGVYPMKGKIFNVRGETTKRISENHEISEIKQILGLENGRKYTADDVSTRLRYGKVLFMTDQDLDGSHIKGLGINLFQSEWPTLAEIPGFIGFMNTPIIKAKKGTQERVFYNEGEFEQWKQDNSPSQEGGSHSSVVPNGWNIKYYKGLGTSTGKEFKEYFERKKIVGFTHNGQESDDAIDMVFNKKRADDRKTWLSGYARDAYLDTMKPSVSYEEFISRELIHFSKYDCDRSIPNVMDGLKISLRKILYAGFKKGLKTEIKVAQFSGYVSEHSGYHHGEASLNGAIVGMAQTFVGSNNINIFEPNGQFGTRLQGGKDSASERYIFTQFNKLTRLIFRPEDDKVLTYLNDDGLMVEPIHYVPIIPMILVNGSKGIGTGFSTDIMCYNPIHIIEYVKEMLANDDGVSVSKVIDPYYQGFKGTIEKATPTKYLIKGTYEVINDKKIRVTELPVGYWTDDFKQHLEALMESVKEKDKDGKETTIPAVIKEYSDMSTDTVVDFTITFTSSISVADYEKKAASEPGCNMLEKLLKLYTTQSTTNMHLFDSKEKLKKYADIYEIIRDYYDVRMEYYALRKNAMLDELRKEMVLLSNRARYITCILNDSLDLRKKGNSVVINTLKQMKFDVVDGDEEFKYLLKMAMDSVTEENVARLLKERDAKTSEYNDLLHTSEKQLWIRDLNELHVEYQRWLSTKSRDESSIEKVSGNVKVASVKKVVRKMIVKQE